MVSTVRPTGSQSGRVAGLIGVATATTLGLGGRSRKPSFASSEVMTAARPAGSQSGRVGPEGTVKEAVRLAGRPRIGKEVPAGRRRGGSDGPSYPGGAWGGDNR